MYTNGCPEGVVGVARLSELMEALLEYRGPENVRLGVVTVGVVIVGVVSSLESSNNTSTLVQRRRGNGRGSIGRFSGGSTADDLEACRLRVGIVMYDPGDM